MIMPEPMQRWPGIGQPAELIEKATVDWIPPQVFIDTLSWQVIECLTRWGVPQPIAVVRQTIRWLLLRGSKVSRNGIVLDRRFWRTFAARSARPCSAEVADESPGRSLREVERPCAGSRPGRPGHCHDQYPQVAQNRPQPT